MPRESFLQSSPLRKAPVFLLSGALLVSGCAPQDAPSAEVEVNETATPAEESWEDLLATSDLSQWRGYKREDVPASWSVENGVLAFQPSSDQAARGDLVSREQYGDFELQLEWKISEGGNSGVIYRSTEDQDYPWQTGPEMQVLDDERHPDGKLPSHRAGALYDLIVPPADIARPVGEWNEARLRVEGNHIQQWLNGHKTADVVIGSEEWNELLAQSKFKDMPAFATKSVGHIVLQDHDDPVWYRNIRIRRLDGGK